MRKPKPPLEKVEHAQIVKLIRSIGGVVHVLGMDGTMESPGVPELIAFLPATATRRGIRVSIDAKEGPREPR